MTPDELLRLYPRETLRWLRGRLGLSQLAFALRIGGNLKSVSNWESRRAGISPLYQRRIVPLLPPYLETDAGAAFLASLGGEG